jgi:hypothetical protein
MTVAINNQAHMREALAQDIVQALLGPVFMAMQEDGLATGQIEKGLEAECMQGLVMLRLPLGLRIIIATHGNDLTTGRPHRIEDMLAHDIPGMHGDITSTQDIGNARIEMAVRVGNNTDAGAVRG